MKELFKPLCVIDAMKKTDARPISIGIAWILAALPILAAVTPAAAQGQAAQPAPLADTPTPVKTPDLSPGAVNGAQFTGTPLPEGPSALVLKLQVLLDRAGYSPGVIDGVMGENVSKAIVAAEAGSGLAQNGVITAELWQVLAGGQDGAVLGTYRITPQDVAGPFAPDLPSDYGELAKLKRAAYRDPREMFAERFHMDERLLADMNPEADFAVPGTELIVALPGEPKAGPPVTYLIADKTRKMLLGYDAENRLIVAYPATIGSKELPSPSGVHRVNAIARNAAYYYRPDVNFKQGNNTKKLTIPPGPNNPIGTTWIDLTEPTYGIHGTPEPSRIDKTNSHGCVRLTNWDVEELAGLVKKGVPVKFQ